MGRRALRFASLSLFLACAGCGGSDGSDGPARIAGKSQTGQTDGPTREVFVASAKAICTDAWDTVPPGARDASPAKQLAMGMDTWSDVVRELRELDPPPDEAARIDRMLRHFENAIRAGRHASRADDESALVVFAGLFDQGQKGAAIAHSYGLDVCSPVPAMPSEEDFFESEAYQKAMKDFTRQLEGADLPTLTQP